MSPITYAIHADQHLLKKHHQCSTCNQKYSSYLKYYTEDFCGDNALPKNVKMYVNNTVFKLRFLEEDTEIIGENFANRGFEVSDIFNIHSTLKLEGYSREIQL